MPLLWIHRALATDLRVKFDTVANAYAFGKKLLDTQDESPDMGVYDEELFLITGSLTVGQSTNLQISVEEDTFEPEVEEGWHYWNYKGCTMVTKEEAERLGADKDLVTE